MFMFSLANCKLLALCILQIAGRQWVQKYWQQWNSNVGDGLSTTGVSGRQFNSRYSQSVSIMFRSRYAPCRELNSSSGTISMVNDHRNGWGLCRIRERTHSSSVNEQLWALLSFEK